MFQLGYTLIFSTLNMSLIFFFFFQTEDGIRDFHVTEVQTYALPIFADERVHLADLLAQIAPDVSVLACLGQRLDPEVDEPGALVLPRQVGAPDRRKPC